MSDVSMRYAKLDYASVSILAIFSIIFTLNDSDINTIVLNSLFIT